MRSTKVGLFGLLGVLACPASEPSEVAAHSGLALVPWRDLDLRKADLRGRDLRGVDLAGTRLDKARLDGCDAISPWLNTVFVTEDFAPVLPWLGVVLWGLAAGRWVLAQRRGWLTGVAPAALGPLATLGRWSLSFYMLHQPVLIGTLWLVLMLRR